MADEWTFVSHKKTFKHGRHGRKGKGPTATACSGLYRSSVDGATTRKQQVGENDDGINRIKNDILAILHALENQLRSGNGFAFRLITSMAVAASCTDVQDGDVHHVTKKADDANQPTTDSHLHLREIVAYGIGNFAKERFQAPMLQLACLLLLRRCAAGSINQSTKANQAGQSDNDDEANNGHDSLRSFEFEQSRVPIFYYEPNILPVEKAMLETTFHVQVLESNAMGKRTVESMRQQHQLTVAMDESTMGEVPTDTTATTQLKSKCAHTLFYMPHCPMRLYCNVLWAHWDHIFPIDKTRDEPILIFGNSFLTYEERVISSEKRADPTNGVFSIVPFSKEVSVGKAGSRNSGIVVDELRHLAVAFNDCNVISFLLSCSDGDHGGGDDMKENVRWPNHPEEYTESEDPDYTGELI